jgi:hypothetical protein
MNVTSMHIFIYLIYTWSYQPVPSVTGTIEIYTCNDDDDDVYLKDITTSGLQNLFPY